MIVAGIDCGTNSIRLLVAQVTKFGVKDIIRVMKIVRLGENVDKTGRFSHQALNRTFDACREFAAICKENNVEKIRFVATSASRDAENKKEFLLGVKEILGVDVEIISGEQEAYLSFIGAKKVLESENLKNLLPNFSYNNASRNEPNVLLIDLGGGSTEFVSGKTIPERSISLNMGCVRISEKFLRTGVNDFSIASACDFIDKLVEKADKEIDFSKIDSFIGVAGTITCVTANFLKLDKYDPHRIHGNFMTFEQAIASCDEIIFSTKIERDCMGFLHPKRADVICGGALVFRQILKYFSSLYSAGKLKFNGVITSENDILDGIVMSICGI